MLPLDQPLTEQQQDAVRQAVLQYVQDENGCQVIPFSKIATEIGMAPATVSEFLRGKYKGRNDNIARMLNLWLDRHAKRARSIAPRDYVSTWVCEEMSAVVRLADRRQKMAAIVSPSGSGKDMVIDALAEELGGIVVYCDMEMTARG